jgi:protein-S-isoprenylcysteine O-methyltransferase Ste14
VSHATTATATATEPATAPTVDAGAAEADTVAPSTWRATLRANRGLLIIGVIVILVALVLAVAQSRRFAGAFDPDGVDPSGSHALAALLADQGVTVVRVTDARAAAAALTTSHGDATLLVVPTASLSPQMIAAVRDAPRSRTVLLAPDADTLATFAPSAREAQPLDDSPDELAPTCSWSVAQLVGSLPSQGMTYTASGNGVSTCWRGLVVDWPGPFDSATTVIGAAGAITNARLADSGYAALGLNTLGHSRTLVWWVPSYADPLQFGTGDTRPTLSDLVPSWVGWFLLQLAVAVGIVVWWRGRRLGRVVVEPLPVTVRATETVEGRARLYRRGRARGRAADALRGASAERLRRQLALPRAAPLDTIVVAASAHTGRTAVEITGLLSPGNDPHDDASLTGLADALDTLENEVRRT